jgi:aspartyl-tRNA(Asn)/glutamyl-tRNA(Gln) amidotransferase subunit B
MDPSVAQTILSVQDTAGNTHARRVANWYASAASEFETSDNRAIIDSARLAELSTMVEANELSSTAGKEIFVELLEGNDASAHEIAKTRNLLQMSDHNEIIVIVEQVLADPSSQQAVADIKAGNDKAIGFLVGQVMKLSKGKANPAFAQELIRDRL